MVSYWYQFHKVDNLISIGYKRFVDAWYSVLLRGRSPSASVPSENEWEHFNHHEPVFKEETLTQLINRFPDIVQTAKIKLQELEENKIALNDEYTIFLDNLLQQLNTNDPILISAAIDIASVPMQENEDKIRYWEKIAQFGRESTTDDTIDDIDILKAKEYPIAYIHKPNGAGFIRCPFHNEKTASCKVYQNNRFFCFGCSRNGDVIDIIMQEDQLTFTEAVVKILNKS